MLGYYLSLLSTNRKRLGLWIYLTIIFALNIILIILMKVFEAENPIINRTIYLAAAPTIYFFNFIVFWFLFYRNIFLNINATNIEILSFTSGLSRKQIFFSKFLNFLTLTVIHALLSAILFVIVTGIPYSFSSPKVGYGFLGTLLIGIFGGILFYFLMFFIDGLVKQNRFKKGLYFVPLVATIIIHSVFPIIESTATSRMKDPGKGGRDFQEIQFLKTNDSASNIVSLTTTSTYAEFDLELEKVVRVNKNLAEYQKSTENVKLMGILTKYLNFANVVIAAQGFEDLVIDNNAGIFNYYSGLDLDLLKDVYNISANGKTIYFKNIDLFANVKPYTYNVDPVVIKNLKDSYTIEINKIIENVRGHAELQNSTPKWLVLQKFIIEQMNQAFSQDKFQYKSEFLEEKAKNPNLKNAINYPTEETWLSTYIFLKANINNKSLELPTLYTRNEETNVFEDENGNKLENSKINGNNDATANVTAQEFEKKLRESEIAKTFYDNFIDPKKVFATRIPTPEYEYPWISYLLIIVLIGGMGLWGLKVYSKKDVA